MERIFGKDVPPVLGKLSIYDVRRDHLRDALSKVERRGALGVAKKIRIWVQSDAPIQCAAISQKPTNRISSARVMAS